MYKLQTFLNCVKFVEGISRGTRNNIECVVQTQKFTIVKVLCMHAVELTAVENPAIMGHVLQWWKALWESRYGITADVSMCYQHGVESESESFEGHSDSGPYLFHLDFGIILLQSV